MPNDKPVGIVGISTAETARFSSFYASLGAMQRPDNIQVVFARSAVISENRNAITQHMLDSGAEWVLYLDDDHILHKETLIKLLAANKDIISAHYTRRQPNFNSVAFSAELPDGSFIWKQLSPKDRGLVTVAGVGAGCLLVKRKVIEAIEKPYWTLGQIDPASWCDDLHFCSRVRKAGFDVWLDLDNPVGHSMVGVVWPQFDDERGWIARYAQDPQKEVIAEWPMPLEGDPF